MNLFNFGPNNRLGTAPIVSDVDWATPIATWLSGRVFGFYVSLTIPRRGQTEARWQLRMKWNPRRSIAANKPPESTP